LGQLEEFSNGRFCEAKGGAFFFTLNLIGLAYSLIALRVSGYGTRSIAAQRQ